MVIRFVDLSTVPIIRFKLLPYINCFGGSIQMPIDPITLIGTVLTLASLYQNQKANEKSDAGLRQGTTELKRSKEMLKQGAIDAEATTKIIGREGFIREISGKFERISLHTNTIVEFDTYLTKMEKRITTILSDYTALLNQVSIVSTLMLGVATATFGALLGNTDDQAQWKVNMYVISCVITICLSVYSVIESFFLSIHIYAEESKFIAGLYPHRSTGARSFNLETLKGLSSSYSAVIVAFFLSFLSFSFTILSTIYIGLGLSQYIFGTDDRLAKYQILSDNNTRTLTELEPGFVGVAVTTTIIVIITYMTILWLFVTKYSKYIMWPNTCRQCLQLPRESLKQPMRFTAEEFERLQNKLHNEFDAWNRSRNSFLQRYEKCLIQEDCDSSWDYNDIVYEKDVYKLLRTQLRIQWDKLKELRLLQITDVDSRNDLELLVGETKDYGNDIIRF